jgi:hypothetical protein
MRFEYSLPSGLTFYYELGGKQENKLFVVRFSMGSIKENDIDLRFHEEVKTRDTFEDMQTTIEELKQYCLKQGFKKVKSTKRNVIT